MMEAFRDDASTRSVRSVLTSGDTRMMVVPINEIGTLKELTLDARNLSGLIGMIGVQVMDSFGSLSGATLTSGQVSRREVSLRGGDLVEFTDMHVQVIGGLDLRATWTGIIASAAVEFR